MDPETFNEVVFQEFLNESGIDAEDEDNLIVKFGFVDNDEGQNEFQEAELSLERIFNALQKDGDE